MTNTYAINATRGQEFRTAEELTALGLHPWIPLRLESTYIKERREVVWYDKPYVGKLIFCVIPAIYWRDVVGLKHVIGKPLEMREWDIEGRPATRTMPARPGLKQFREHVEAEYAEAKRRRHNAEYVCQYEPGQALQILAGVFEGRGTFAGVIKRAFEDFPRLRVEVDILGGKHEIEVAPDQVRRA